MYICGQAEQVTFEDKWEHSYTSDFNGGEGSRRRKLKRMFYTPTLDFIF